MKKFMALVMAAGLMTAMVGNAYAEQVLVKNIHLNLGLNARIRLHIRMNSTHIPKE